MERVNWNARNVEALGYVSISTEVKGILGTVWELSTGGRNLPNGGDESMPTGAGDGYPFTIVK